MHSFIYVFLLTRTTFLLFCGSTRKLCDISTMRVFWLTIKTKGVLEVTKKTYIKLTKNEWSAMYFFVYKNSAFIDNVWKHKRLISIFSIRIFYSN